MKIYIVVDIDPDKAQTLLKGIDLYCSSHGGSCSSQVIAPISDSTIRDIRRATAEIEKLERT